MSRFNIALLGEEVEAEDTVTPEATDATLDTIADSPEPEIAEANEVAGDLQDADAAAAEAEEVAETLDAMAGPIEAAQAEGGLTEPAAEAIRIAVEHMKSRIGMSKRKTFAMEGFKSKTTRSQATRVALEDIKETAGKIWEAIVKAFNTAIEWVKKFFLSLFDGATKLKNRATKIKEAAAAKEGKTAAADAKVESESIAEALRLNGKVSEPKDVSANFSRMVADVMGKNSAIEAATKLTEEAEGALAVIEDSEKFKSSLEALAKGVNKFSKARKVDGLDANLKATSSENYFGDKVAVIISLADSVKGDDVLKHIGGIKLSIMDAEGRKPLTKTEMTPLTPKEAAELCGDVEDLATGLINAKGAVEKLNTAQKKLQDDAKKLSGNVKGDAQANAGAGARVARVAISAATTYMVQTNKMLLNIGNSGLNYAAASLSLIGKEEKPAETK